MRATGISARAYRADVLPGDGVTLSLDEVTFDGLIVRDGTLVTPHAIVSERCVLVGKDTSGELIGMPMEPIDLRDGTLCFDPRDGGVRTRDNRLANGAFNDDVAEATRFGMVNVAHHVGIAWSYLNGLLRDLGEPPLPRVRAVVSAHSGSRLPGFGSNDGDFRRSGGRMRPLTGAHYRLSTITSLTPELVPVDPAGEIHFGPGRFRHPFAGRPSYLRNASHNPATIYHEYAHHLCRYTADFRLNAERRRKAQRNGKIGAEEGFCDYIAAALLGHGRPYGWFRADRGARRDPEEGLRRADMTNGESHAIGAVWASALWRCRRELLDNRILEEPRDHDRIVLETLLGAGRVGAPDGRRRLEREAERCATMSILFIYLQNIERAGGARAKAIAQNVVTETKLSDTQSAGAGAC